MGMTEEPTTWIVCAHATEGARLRARGLPVQVLGVGKVAATLSLARLLTAGCPRGIVVVGVAGAYPARHRNPGALDLEVGSVVVVGESVLADEGVETESDFRSFSEFGLDDRAGRVADPAWTASVAQRLGVPIVRSATVSTCSGSETLSRGRVERAGALVETMESAAIAEVCRSFDVPFVEVRAISNWTGDRERSDFHLELAADAVQDAVLSLWDEGLLVDR